MGGDLGLVALCGAFGLIVGSFLNVCIIRWPLDQSVVRPRSACPGCQAPIAWYDNIPVVSWLVLGGACRRCGRRISVQYPLVELGTAALWAVSAWLAPTPLAVLTSAVFLTILLGIAMADARTYIIPDEFTLGGLALGIAASVPGGYDGILAAVVGAAVGFGGLWLVGAAGTWLFKEEAMGGGDIKMMAMVGAFLGWQGVLLTIFLGALLGTLIFLPISLLGRKKLVPFGVFLSLGAAATHWVGPAIIAWYRGYLGVG